MIWLLRLLFWGPTAPVLSCKEGGAHKYRPRYDEINDPRFSSEELRSLIEYTNYGEKYAVRVRIYVKDICDGCGDVVERLEGLNAMQVIAYASKRIA